MGIVSTKLSRWLWPNKEIRILLLGLHGAGKTTMWHKLKLGEVLTISNPTIPILGFEIKTVSYKNLTFTSWDVDAHDQDMIHPFLQRYIRNTAAVVFMVDSTDRDRIEEARDQLHGMMNEKALRDAVLLVFANKGDVGNRMSVDEIIDWVEFHSLPQSHRWIMSCCATSGEGLYEGMEWISDKLKEREA